MAVTKNTWNKGLNSDLSKLKSQPDSYLDAKNIRVITDTGTSTFAIENVRGTEYSFTIPQVQATYAFDFTGITSIVKITLSITDLTVPISVSYDIYINPTSKSNEDIANELNAALQDPLIMPLAIIRDYVRFYFNSDEVILYHFLSPNDFSTWSPISVACNTANILTTRTQQITNHTILGWGYYNNNLVLITCDENSNSADPKNDILHDTEGFIWDIKYDNETNKPLNVTANNVLIPYNPVTNEYTLKYAGELTLSRYYAINKHLKCRYESTEKTRLVWTDWHNDLRICNIADPQIWATPPELFSYMPRHLAQKPVVSALIPGGTLPTGKYQYFYQLYSNQGATSTFSPVSNLITLFPGDLTKYYTTGQKPGVNADRSVEITITDVDTNYDTIRIGYIVYQTPDFPEAFYFDERPIPDNGTVVIIHNGNEKDIPLDSTEVANLNRAPEIFKTIDVVKNRLFAANAITKYFDLTDEFDSRAYRYDSSQIANLYNEYDQYGSPSVIINTNPISGYADITINGTTTNYPDATSFKLALTQIPDTYDLINPFNNENNDASLNPFSQGNWETNSQFMYKQDGVTIGGQGANIEYEFLSKENIARIAGWSSRSPYLDPSLDYWSSYDQEFKDGKVYPGGDNQEFFTHKGPLFETLFVGYARGEVYRFGIVFYDRYGYPSYPQWIGDIKFPLASEFGISNLEGGGTTSHLEKPATNTILDVNNIQSFGTLVVELLKPNSETQIVYNNIAYIYKAGLNPTLVSFCAQVNNFFAPQGITFIADSPTQLTVKAINDSITFLNTFVRFKNNNIPYGHYDLYLRGNFAGYKPNGNDVKLYQLGIKFRLNTNTKQFNDIKDKISGWSFVRLKRELPDSTRLGTGIIQPTILKGNPNRACLIPFVNNHSSTNDSTDSTGHFGYGKVAYSGSGGSNTVPINDYGINFQTFYSPNFITRAVGSYSQTDYIRFIGRTFNYSDRPKYVQEIFTVPNWNSDWLGYYLAAGDVDYNYADSFTNTNGSPTAANKKYPLKNRVYVPHSTSGNIIPSSQINADWNNNKQYDFINMTSPNYSNEIAKENFGQWGAECELLVFNNSNPVFNNVPHPDTVKYMYDNGAAGNNTIYWGFYFGSYERFLTRQYGGWTRADRYANEYISTNHFVSWPTIENFNYTNPNYVENEVFGGDTYVNYFDYQFYNTNYNGGSGWGASVRNDSQGKHAFAAAVFFPAEVRFNSELNTIYQHAAVRNEGQLSGTDSIFASNYVYNPALSQQNTSNVFISKAYLQTNVKEEPHTIYASQRKLDNEQNDSWRAFLINDALSVNGNYGEINRIIQFKDRLFFYQNDAVGIAAVEERILENTGEATQTQLGTGTVLQRYDYLSTETGSKHSFGVVASSSAIYHYDSFINKFFKLQYTSEGTGLSPLTDIKGLSGFFRNTFFNSKLKSVDKILYKQDPLIIGSGRVGITSEFNSEYNSVYFTFFDESYHPLGNEPIKYTISFNELMDAFESFYDFYPSMYLNMRKRFLSIDYTDNNTESNDTVYIHNIGFRNSFYGNIFPSIIKFRVNENSDIVKTFDNIHINSEIIDPTGVQLQETVQQLGIINDYQLFNKQSVNFTPKFRTWRIAIPRDELSSFSPRMADKYMDVILEHSNTVPTTLNRIFRLHDVITEYSFRSKILPK